MRLRLSGPDYLPLKRLIDVVGASAALVLLSPIMAAVAALIRLRMGSPVLFRQRRPGLRGQSFTLLKFRTMREGDEPDEVRLTRLGLTLRTSSLDELPELVNVIRGDMSLIGPRPLLEEYLPLYNDEQVRRHEIRPGLTGLAQVNGRNDTTWEDRLALDVEYVESVSLRLDIAILIKTAEAVLLRSGVAHPSSATMPHFDGGT